LYTKKEKMNIQGNSIYSRIGKCGERVYNGVCDKPIDFSKCADCDFKTEHEKEKIIIRQKVKQNLEKLRKEETELMPE